MNTPINDANVGSNFILTKFEREVAPVAVSRTVFGSLAWLSAAVFALLVTCLPAAQAGEVMLSYLESTEPGASNITGQSFTPLAADFPTSVAYLVQMQFQAGGTDETPVYLDIYTTLDEGVFSGYIGSSINSLTWTPATINTWTFAYLPLDVDMTYYAVFSTDAIAGNVVNRPTGYYEDNIYGGGEMIYLSEAVPDQDTGFSATFATSAIPEPSTYAALVGLAVFGLVTLRRRLRW